MTDQELEQMLLDIESDRAERKAALSDADEVRKAICAFANDLPNHGESGVVIIGAHNDGAPANLVVTDELLRQLSDMRSDGNLLPFPTMSVEKRRLRGADMAVVIVEPSYAPPVRLRGRTWIRVGPRKAVATPEEEKRLSEKRRAHDLPFDISPVLSASLDDLDLRAFEEVYLPNALAHEILEQNQRHVAQQLASLRFATADGADIPTALGVLVIGKDPRQHIFGAYIQLLRLAGTQLSDPIKDQKLISGPLAEMIATLDTALAAHILIETDITSQTTEQRTPDYPLAALQQVTRNAVLHRTYEGTNAPVRVYWFDDRIEVHNPGGPYGQVNRQNFGQLGVTDYRNRFLAEAMRNLGFVQQFGVGLQIARRELEKNGNPPLEFSLEETHTLVTIRRRK